MVSHPDFDPNNIASEWEALNSDEEHSPLLNRATGGSYAPGSVFKIITALAYMRQNPDYADYTYECSGSITLGDTTISCAGRDRTWNRRPQKFICKLLQLFIH